MSDILVYNIDVYGSAADAVIRQISALCSDRDLYAWWDEKIASSDDRNLVLARSSP